jgi:hypothetical protein
MSRPTTSPLSHRAAHLHALSLIAGPPRHQGLVLPGAAVTALAAAGALPFSSVAAVCLGLLAGLLVGIAVEDRRSAWRYRAAPSTPAQLLPPRLPSSPFEPAQEPEVIDLRTTATPPVIAVHVPTPTLPVAFVPAPRVARPVERRHRARGTSTTRRG